MKITKFVHSCLLIESPGINALIDPGNYTWGSHLLRVDRLPVLDYVVITHEHPDHYDEYGLRELSRHFPHAAIITNTDLANKIATLKLPNPVRAGSEDNLTVFEAKHEPLPLATPNVLNIGVHVANKLTHTGDSYDLPQSREVLALPLTGPFASYRQALDVIVKLKPRVVLPIHDWEWHKAARQNRYSRAKQLLNKYNIEFIELESGDPVEL